MNLVLLSRDLMLGARVEGAARNNGLSVITVADPDAAVLAVKDENCRALLIDLRLAGVQLEPLIASVRQKSVSQLSILACGPHVHEARLAEASSAGCDRVLTRGQLDRDAEIIFRDLL